MFHSNCPQIAFQFTDSLVIGQWINDCDAASNVCLILSKYLFVIRYYEENKEEKIRIYGHCRLISAALAFNRILIAFEFIVRPQLKILPRYFHYVSHLPQLLLLVSFMCGH